MNVSVPRLIYGPNAMLSFFLKKTSLGITIAPAYKKHQVIIWYVAVNPKNRPVAPIIFMSPPPIPPPLISEIPKNNIKKIVNPNSEL